MIIASRVNYKVRYRYRKCFKKVLISLEIGVPYNLGMNQLMQFKKNSLNYSFLSLSKKGKNKIILSAKSIKQLF